MHKELTGVAMMKEVLEMFKPMASKIDQTELRKAILQLNIDLAPLIAKGHTLSHFIDSVNKEAEKEERIE